MDDEQRRKAKKAAFSASYILEGVKDQKSINLAVAESLLRNRDIYLKYRTQFSHHMQPAELDILDAWHKTGKYYGRL